MTRFLCICARQLFASQACASDSFTSESSHLIFGTFLGAVSTWAANFVWPEYRVLIGFAFAASAGFVEEATAKSGFSMLDAIWNMVGAAIGSGLTDQLLLAPVVKREAGNSYVGVLIQRRFWPSEFC